MSCSSSTCGRYESGYWGTRYFVNAVHTDDAGVRCQGISLHDCILVSLCIVNYMYLLQWTLLRSMLQATVHMEMFVWWEAPPSMRVEWKCASMTGGGQCVMTPGTVH